MSRRWDDANCLDCWNDHIDEHWDEAAWVSFVRTLWAFGAFVLGLVLFFLFEFFLDRLVERNGKTARCHFIASLTWAIGTAIALTVFAKTAMHHALPWAKQWEVSLPAPATRWPLQQQRMLHLTER